MKTQATSGYRWLLWVGLGTALIIFYVTFITARTYYNPAATVLIIILGATVALGGILSSKWPHSRDTKLLESPLITKARTFYSHILAATLLSLSADVAITLHGVSTYGTTIEANRVVASLLERGAYLDWLGQQYTPVILAAVTFTLSKNHYVKTMAAFYTLGTLGYALVTVMNNLVILYGLVVKA